MKNMIKLSLLVGVFALFVAGKPAVAAMEAGSCTVSSAVAATQTIAFENESNVDDHMCYRRCEHRYRSCVSHCHHGHHGRVCREHCEREYRRCTRHCGH